MNKDVLTGFLRDKPEALLVVKPLDFAAGHNVLLSFPPLQRLDKLRVRKDHKGKGVQKACALGVDRTY
jgi:hypothetical protein